MPYNFLLITIIASYIILRYSLFFKYNLQRRAKDVLIFETIVLAVPMIIVGVFLNYLIKINYPNEFRSVSRYIGNNVYNAETRFFYTFFIVAISTLILVFLVQSLFVSLMKLKVIDQNYFSLRAIRKYGDELEKFITYCITEGKLAQFTLKNGKVYIGFCKDIPTPGMNNFIFILPLYSGYREKESHLLHINTTYIDLLYRMTQSDDENFKIIGVSIKKDEILSYSIYDKKIFNEFNKSDSEKDN